VSIVARDRSSTWANLLRDADRQVRDYRRAEKRLAEAQASVAAAEIAAAIPLAALAELVGRDRAAERAGVTPAVVAAACRTVRSSPTTSSTAPVPSSLVTT
jgi:hypothetical protein